MRNFGSNMYNLGQNKTDDFTKFCAVLSAIGLIIFCYLLTQSGPYKSPCKPGQKEIMIYSHKDTLIMCQ